MSGHLRERSAGRWELRWRLAAGRSPGRSGGKREAEAGTTRCAGRGRPRRDVAPTQDHGWPAGRRADPGVACRRPDPGRTREGYETAAKRLAPIADIPVQRLGSADVERCTSAGATSVPVQARHPWRLAARSDRCGAASDLHPQRRQRSGSAAVIRQDGGSRHAHGGEVAAPAGQAGGDEWRVPVVTALYAVCGEASNWRCAGIASTWTGQDADRRGAGRSRRQGHREAAQNAAGRRTITLPAIVIETLREHRRRQLERCLLLGREGPPRYAWCFPAGWRPGRPPRVHAALGARSGTLGVPAGHLA